MQPAASETPNLCLAPGHHGRVWAVRFAPSGNGSKGGGLGAPGSGPPPRLLSVGDLDTLVPRPRPPYRSPYRFPYCSVLYCSLAPRSSLSPCLAAIRMP